MPVLEQAPQLKTKNTDLEPEPLPPSVHEFVFPQVVELLPETSRRFRTGEMRVSDDKLSLRSFEQLFSARRAVELVYGEQKADELFAKHWEDAAKDQMGLDDTGTLRWDFSGESGGLIMDALHDQKIKDMRANMQAEAAEIAETIHSYRHRQAEEQHPSLLHELATLSHRVILSVRNWIIHAHTREHK